MKQVAHRCANTSRYIADRVRRQESNQPPVEFFAQVNGNPVNACGVTTSLVLTPDRYNWRPAPYFVRGAVYRQKGRGQASEDRREILKRAPFLASLSRGRTGKGLS